MNTFDTGERVSYNGLDATVMWQVIGAVAIKFDDGTTQVVPANDLTVPSNTNENEA